MREVYSERWYPPLSHEEQPTLPGWRTSHAIYGGEILSQQEAPKKHESYLGNHRVVSWQPPRRRRLRMVTHTQLAKVNEGTHLDVYE